MQERDAQLVAKVDNLTQQIHNLQGKLDQRVQEIQSILDSRVRQLDEGIAAWREAALTIPKETEKKGFGARFFGK